MNAAEVTAMIQRCDGGLGSDFVEKSKHNIFATKSRLAGDEWIVGCWAGGGLGPRSCFRDFVGK